jgi:hypothetical protein
MPMDRIGMFLEDMTVLAKSMAERNLQLWTTVSQHLRERPYTMDTLAEDAANGMEAAMSNIQDTWDFLQRAPERELVADRLPTAFLLIAVREDDHRLYTPPVPVWLRVPRPNVRRLPDFAQIALTGDDPEGVTLLKAALRAQLGQSRQAYLLEAVNVNKPFLKEGVYTGSVYLKQPIELAIADLRVIVEPRDEG